MLRDDADSDYEIKVSVWNIVDSRLSKDVVLEHGDTDCLAMFELATRRSSADAQTYCFVDLVHR